MGSVRFSSLIQCYSDTVMTPDNKLVIFYPTNRLFDYKEIKSEWFSCCAPGGYMGLNTYLSLSDASSVTYLHGDTAKYIAVYTLDLKGICHGINGFLKVYQDAMALMVDGRIWVTIGLCDWVDGGLCRILNYELVKYMEYKEALYNNQKSYDWKRPLVQSLLTCPLVVFED